MRIEAGITEQIVAGMQLVGRAVQITYGPQGLPAALDRMAGLTFTRDGLTVVREVRPGGVAQLGADLVLEACARTNERAGDGTSATALIAAAAIKAAHSKVLSGVSAVQLGAQMRLAAAEAVALVRSKARPVRSYDVVEHIALRSCGGDAEVAGGIRQGLETAGENGIIVVEAGLGRSVDVCFTEGVLLRSGVKSQSLLPPDGGERIMRDPLVAVCCLPLLTERDVIALLQSAADLGKSLCVVAPQIEGRALATFILNNEKKTINVVVLEAPGVGEWKTRYLHDVAAATGATAVDPLLGYQMASWNPEWFGIAGSCSVTSNRTIINPAFEGSAEISQRCVEIQLELEGSTSEYDRDRHNERLASLSGAICTLRVGGTTEPEARERRTRVEDAVRACQAALREGCVQGGGYGFFEAANDLTGTSPGEMVVREALQAPLRTIATSLNLTWAAALQKIAQEGAEWSGQQSLDSILSVTEAISNGIAAATSGIECSLSIRGQGQTG